MTRVHVPLRHRADHDSDLAALGLSLSLAVVDPEPRADAERRVDGGCASCSFVTFLKGRPDLADYEGLVHVLRVLDRFAAQGSGRPIGAGASVFRIARERRTETERLLHVDDGGERPWSDVRSGDAVVLRPDAAGPGRLETLLAEALRAGAQTVLLGYVRHADAVDHFAAFLEHPDLHGGWLSVLARARHLGVRRLGFAMAYPPCATLQWSRNRALESLRARLDLQFRRLDNEASMMCPENVSGYSLLNDTRDSLSHVPIATSRYAIRVEDNLVVF